MNVCKAAASCPCVTPCSLQLYKHRLDRAASRRNRSAGSQRRAEPTMTVLSDVGPLDSMVALYKIVSHLLHIGQAAAPACMITLDGDALGLVLYSSTIVSCILVYLRASVKKYTACLCSILHCWPCLLQQPLQQACH